VATFHLSSAHFSYLTCPWRIPALFQLARQSYPWLVANVSDRFTSDVVKVRVTTLGNYLRKQIVPFIVGLPAKSFLSTCIDCFQFIIEVTQSLSLRSFGRFVTIHNRTNIQKGVGLLINPCLNPASRIFSTT
jgi:hypothetical protein